MSENTIIYRTTDGQEFLNKEDADTHQNTLPPPVLNLDEYVENMTNYLANLANNREHVIETIRASMAVGLLANGISREEAMLMGAEFGKLVAVDIIAFITTASNSLKLNIQNNTTTSWLNLLHPKGGTIRENALSFL